LRRILVFAGLVALGALLVAVIRAPERKTGFYAVRGTRVVRVPRHAVRRLDVALGARRFSAEHWAGGWQIDGHPASPGTAAALDDLTDTLVGLRAVDAFRSRDASSYGLDRPRGTIDVFTARGVHRLLLGSLNAAGSTFYARRLGDPRTLQLGTLLLSEIERVFYNRDGPPRAPGPVLGRMAD
jgi:hypothetical protein